MKVRLGVIFFFFFLMLGTTPRSLLAAEKGPSTLPSGWVQNSGVNISGQDPGQSAGQNWVQSSGQGQVQTPDASAGQSMSQSTGQSPTPSADLSQQVDLSKMQGFLQGIDQEAQASLPGFSLTGLLEGLKQGKLDLKPQDIMRSLLAFLTGEVLKTAPLIGKFLVLAVLLAVLQQLQEAFDGSVGKLSRFLSYLVLLSLAMAAFQSVLETARGAIDQMVGLMQALFPAMLTLLLAMGNFATAALFRPMVMASLTFLATLFKNIVLPLFFLAAVLRLFNQISEQFKLNKLAGLIEFGGKVSLGLVMTLFVALMTLQGVTGGVADGVTLRTAKYSVDLIPVVGKFFKDSVELVVTSGLLLRNALGVVAFIALLIICLGPLVKILAMMFVFRLSAALIEPLGEQSLANALQDMAKSLTYIFAALASVGVMFFIAIVVVVSSGNLALMLH
ncbi:stage III sporulation protein AE [Acididesulfobacillus acetoxydans]|uniref:Stage III sporulation protein AE n=1 Tax=Acididesulfobacillus acetoxydans TaxID=1561005 RepID=A0A8S0XC76_9FIRM|nr:stage III sporulation protein AE [Acididesulfobacillus acetoxydans]CAA7602136.1 stage III sporulation protein AE [Acididesulfobacillus acetoxydans]CEJ08021.1 Stage III sporulation protein AE [Acididesulfobacillus acetoxydans]